MDDDYPIADTLVPAELAHEPVVFTIEAPPPSWDLFTPPRAGSKGYQRRQNQRWPKGR